MAKDPAVLFYTSDFLTGTSFFTDEQRGQYIRLLCEQHQNGHIPENHMVSVCFSLDSPVVKKFVKDDQGNYYNERMEEEIIKRREFTESRRNNGKLGGRPRASDKPNGKPSEEATNNLGENENGNDNINEDVIEIYDMYPSKCWSGRKTGKSRKPNTAKIKKLLKEYTKDQLKELITTYIEDCNKTKTYIKNFTTFLNNLPDMEEQEKPKLRFTVKHPYGERMTYECDSLQKAKEIYAKNKGVEPNEVEQA